MRCTSIILPWPRHQSFGDSPVGLTTTKPAYHRFFSTLYPMDRIQASFSMTSEAVYPWSLSI